MPNDESSTKPNDEGEFFASSQCYVFKSFILEKIFQAANWESFSTSAWRAASKAETISRPLRVRT